MKLLAGLLLALQVAYLFQTVCTQMNVELCNSTDLGFLANNGFNITTSGNATCCRCKSPYYGTNCTSTLDSDEIALTTACIYCTGDLNVSSGSASAMTPFHGCACTSGIVFNTYCDDDSDKGFGLFDKFF